MSKKETTQDIRTTLEIGTIGEIDSSHSSHSSHGFHSFHSSHSFTRAMGSGGWKLSRQVFTDKPAWYYKNPKNLTLYVFNLNNLYAKIANWIMFVKYVFCSAKKYKNIFLENSANVLFARVMRRRWKCINISTHFCAHTYVVYSIEPMLRMRCSNKSRSRARVFILLR